MRRENFKVIDFIRELILKLDKNLDNFPKKDIEIKNKIRLESYDLLELAYLANSKNSVDFRMLQIDKCVAKIKVIDFLVNLSYDKEIINKKRYYNFGETMDRIIKYLVGWRKSLAEDKQKQIQKEKNEENQA